MSKLASRGLAQLAALGVKSLKVTGLMQLASENTEKKIDKSALPVALMRGVEALSNRRLDDVRLHMNSGEPAKVGAHAYAQGKDIHVAPGQEKHIPHEAWHVVQQAQGRVKPTMQMAGMAVNDDQALEREADVMGARALERGMCGR